VTETDDANRTRIDDWASELDVPRHPLADQFTAPKTDTPGQCVCGAVLAPMREWDDYPHQWAHTTCKQCGRGFVDEDDYIAIYDDGLGDDDE
jgi:hypothetical protein